MSDYEGKRFFIDLIGREEGEHEFLIKLKSERKRAIRLVRKYFGNSRNKREHVRLRGRV